MNWIRVWGASLALASVCVLGVGCMSPYSQRQEVPMSTLERRALQTRTYEGIDGTAALKAAVHVLQDQGFQIQHTEADLGLAYAKVTWAGYISDSFAFNGGPESTLEATVTVDTFRRQVKVRVSFQQNVANPVSWFDNGKNATPILDPKHYQEFFAKLDQSIFLKKQGL